MLNFVAGVGVLLGIIIGLYLVGRIYTWFEPCSMTGGFWFTVNMGFKILVCGFFLSCAFWVLVFIFSAIGKYFLTLL
jgi:hypothetical protein